MAEEKKKKHVFLWIIIILALCGLAFFGYKLWGIYKMYHTSAVKFEAVTDAFYASVSGDETKKPEGNEWDGGFSLDALVARNPECVGWIHIDDTKIDFPVMKDEETGEKYLHRDFEGNYDYSGCPFMALENTIGGELENYIIYGHHMVNGTMFHDLTFYKDSEFFEEHPYYILILRVGDYDITYHAEIFSIHGAAEFDEEDENWWTARFTDGEQRTHYIETATNRSEHETNIEINEGDTLVMLSTCDGTYDHTSGRFLVHAKLTEIARVKVNGGNHAKD